MNAQIQPRLSDRERAEIMNRLYEEKIKDYPFIVEALGEANITLAALISDSLSEGGDEFILRRAIQEAVKIYIDSELMEEAEQEELASIERNGR